MINIQLIKINDEWVAECDKLQVYTSGTSFRNALQEFIEVVEDFETMYRENTDKLSSEAIRLQKIFKGLSYE